MRGRTGPQRLTHMSYVEPTRAPAISGHVRRLVREHERGWRHAALVDRRSCVRLHLVPAFEHLRIEQLTSPGIERWKSDFLIRTGKRREAAKLVALIHSMLRASPDPLRHPAQPGRRCHAHQGLLRSRRRAAARTGRAHRSHDLRRLARRRDRTRLNRRTPIVRRTAP
jgi:hypothetical protein